MGDSGLKTDVVGRFTEACRKRGLQPCLYVNMLDIHKLCGPGTRFGRRFKDRKIKRDSPEYHEFQRAITEELVTTYKPYMVWYDDMAAREEAWAKFRDDPDWKRISKDPKWAGTVSNITNTHLQPLPFSPIR